MTASTAISSGSSVFSNGPVTKSATGMARRPFAPCAITEPPSAVTTEAQSPWGSAWQSEPTRVPRLRTSGSAISGAAAAMVGWVLFEPADVVDVDDQFRRREAQLHQRYRALAAGHHLRLVPALGQQADG